MPAECLCGHFAHYHHSTGECRVQGCSCERYVADDAKERAPLLAEEARRDKMVDNEQLRMDQLRIKLLKDWIKAEVSGVAPKCAGCSILAALYEECKDVLPEKWRAAIWKMTHASGLMRVANKKDEGALFIK